MDAWFWVVLILLFIIALCIIHNIKWNKQDIADSYCICRKTLNKWVKYSCPNIDNSYWLSKRKLNVIEMLSVSYQLGFPQQQKPLTKGAILERCETLYKTVRENVALNLVKIGLTPTAYKNMDVFPPRVSMRIVSLLG